MGFCDAVQYPDYFPTTAHPKVFCHLLNRILSSGKNKHIQFIVTFKVTSQMISLIHLHYSSCKAQLFFSSPASLMRSLEINKCYTLSSEDISENVNKQPYAAFTHTVILLLQVSCIIRCTMKSSVGVPTTGWHSNKCSSDGGATSSLNQFTRS